MEIALKIFKSSLENPLSLIVDRFLKRQLYLDGTLHVTNQLKNEVHISAGHFPRDIDGISVFTAETYEITPINRNILHKQLQNYFYMNLIAQSVENFETYLKTVVDTLRSNYHVEENRQGSLLNRILISMFKKEKQLRSNSERIKYIKKASPKVTNYIQSKEYKTLYDLFLVIEQVRHLTVHSSMKVTTKSRFNTKSVEFVSYFSLSQIDDENVVTVTDANARTIFNKLSTLAYMIFKGLSEEYGLPVIEIPQYVPPKEVLEKMIAQAKTYKE